MPNGEPAYTVIMVEKEDSKYLRGHAYLKMSAIEYIKSLPETYQQWIDPAVPPNKIPDNLRSKKGKVKKQKKRARLINSLSQEKVIE